MKLNRDITVVINKIMDQWIPPVIRDSSWFMGILMKLFAGDKAPIYMQFKGKAFNMSNEEFADAYIQTAAIVERETDLNESCVQKILGMDLGKTVLDAGCGRGFLIGKLKDNYQLTGCDVVVEETMWEQWPGVECVAANLENLPFEDDQFDTVICTHVLEHVLDPQATIRELRRVAREKLIIIVPCERPYEHTFSLHLHFFPYVHSLLFMLGRIDNGSQDCSNVGGDWFYIEEYVK